MANKKGILSVFSQDFIWFKNGIITFLTIFLLSILFVSGCERKGNSAGKDMGSADKDMGKDEESKMDSFVKKCNAAHDEWVVCMREGVACPKLSPFQLLISLPQYIPPVKEIIENITECQIKYKEGIEESFKFLSKEQLEQKQNIFEELKAINLKQPLRKDIIKCRFTDEQAHFTFSEVSKQKLCSKVE